MKGAGKLKGLLSIFLWFLFSMPVDGALDDTQAAMPLDQKRRIVRNIIYSFEEANQLDRCRAIAILRKYHPKTALSKYSSDAQESMIRLVRKINPGFPDADYCAYPNLISRLDDVRVEMNDQWLSGDVTVLAGDIHFDDSNNEATVNYKKFLRSPDGSILRTVNNEAKIRQINGVPLGDFWVVKHEEIVSDNVSYTLQSDAQWMKNYQANLDMVSTCVSANDCRNQQKHYIIRAQDYYKKCRSENSEILCNRGDLLFDLADVAADIHHD